MRRQLGTWLLAEGRLLVPGCLNGSADNLLSVALDPGGSNHPAIARLRAALDLGRGVSSAPPALQLQTSASVAILLTEFILMLLDTAVALAQLMAKLQCHAKANPQVISMSDVQPFNLSC